MDTLKIDDAKFIKDENKWPCWPILPIKRYKDHQPECGIILAGNPTTVYIAYMFGLDDLPGDTFLTKLIDNKEIVRYTYIDIEHLLGDGWIVD